MHNATPEVRSDAGISGVFAFFPLTMRKMRDIVIVGTDLQVLMTRRTEIMFALGIPLAAILLAGAVGMLYAHRKNAAFGERFRYVAHCRYCRQCVEKLGPAVYDLKTDDEHELAAVNNIFRGQKTWRKAENVNVGLWDGGGIPAKFIYAAYDRTDLRILETGVVQP